MNHTSETPASRINSGSNPLFAVICILMLSAFYAGAKTMTEIAMDSVVNDHKIIQFGKGADIPRDSINNLIAKFYNDQFRHFQDPLAPYFLFMSKDANLAMGVGGCVRMRGYYDWGGSIPTPGFAPYMIPMQKDATRERYLGTTPAGTSLFFRVLGMNKKLGDYQVYIEANFNGYQARDFHLKKAYGIINDWTFGYANSTFSDPAALPPAVDASGPNAKMSATAVLVRWTHNFPKGWTMAASLETPDVSADYNGETTGKVSLYLPNVSMFGQYTWKGIGHIRLSGILRFMPYRNLIQQKNHLAAGWGLQLSGTAAVSEHFTLYGTINGGMGYEGLGGDWQMGKYDLVNELDRPGTMYAPGAIGGFAAIQYNITPSMFVSATYGGARYMPKGKMPADEYKSGMYMAANFFYYFTPRISAAAEFNLGNRENFDGRRRWARRAGLMVQFSF